MSDEPIIPKFEPEAIKAEAQKTRFGDDEKVATTSLDGVTYRGVNLSSRYDKADEYETMIAMVKALPDFYRSRISSVWCDSKASYWWTATMQPGADQFSDCVMIYLEAVCFMRHDGYNGLNVNNSNDEPLYEASGNWHMPDYQG